jgi:F-type H+-transporting ATPase subunit gamma
MAKIRFIRKRITAVGTIQRITKTMQMIATARFTAAVQRAKATQPYTTTIRRLVGEVAAAAGDVSHPLIDGPAAPANRELLLVIGSDRGLCGAYNSNVLRLAMHHVRDLQGRGAALDVEASGKKVVASFKFQKIPIAERLAIGDKPEYEAVEAVAARYIGAFTAGTYDAVRVAFMRYVSNAKQTPEVLQLLPLAPEAAPAEAKAGGGAEAIYEFSPSSAELLAALLPAAVKAQLFQAFIDATVSEQIMRMVAMKAATENAKDLKRSLNRQYNRARQSQITTELSEIMGGAAALE